MLGGGAMITSRIGWAFGVLWGFGLLGSACSGSASRTTPPNTMTNDAGSTGTDPTFCTPGTRRCDGHEIKRCDDTGSELLEQDCLSQECRLQGSEPFCPPTACAANLGVCDGNTATKCKLDGSGPRSGGVDCGASHQFCRGGECRDTLCEPNQKSCKDGNVYLCSADGSLLSLLDACTDGEQCDEGSGTCVVHVCQPNEVSCDGARVVTCDARGSKLSVTTDCAAQGQVCTAGRCEKRACVPSTTFCKGSDRYQCDPAGTSSTLLQTCRAGAEHCEVTPAGLYAFCVSNVCIAGQKVCDGDMVKTCNADGSLPSDGTYCTKDEYCEDAVCKPRSCDLGGLLCKGKDVYSCEHNGPQLYATCEANQACLAVAHYDHSDEFSSYRDLVWCAYPSCPPNATRCALNQIGTCGPDGQSLSTVTNDCAASGKVCTASATCATSVSDTLGKGQSIQTFPAGIYVGNMLEVHSSRKLSELQMWLVFAAPRIIRWMIFEQVGNDFLPRVDKLTTVASSSGYVGSGPLGSGYQLVAGKRYVVGAVLADECVGTIGEVTADDQLSFGALLGSIYTYDDLSPIGLVSSIQPYTSALMMVTTESP